MKKKTPTKKPNKKPKHEVKEQKLNVERVWWDEEDSCFVADVTGSVLVQIDDKPYHGKMRDLEMSLCRKRGA